MFGNLLGTLQKFRQDENKIKDRELKKREIELKIEEKTEKEKDDAKRKKHELFTERDKQKQELRVLQVGKIVSALVKLFKAICCG
jgi:pinin